jgi:hypothetical protein
MEGGKAIACGGSPIMVNHVMDLSAGDGRWAGEANGESDVSHQRCYLMTNGCFLFDRPLRLRIFHY